MKPALFLCLLASFLYAVEIQLTERFLKGVSSIVLTMMFGLTIFLCALAFVVYGSLKGTVVTSDELGSAEEMTTIAWPVGWQWVFIVIVGVATFGADWAHFGAIQKHASGPMLATFYIAIPIMCNMMKGEIPSWKMVLAWILGGAALALIRNELVE